MRPIEALTPQEAKTVEFLLSDIDDTMTEAGKLTPDAYRALWRLSESGIRVIPVTGRPAGWCDMIARQWPVDAVIGENGAFTLYMKDSHLHRMDHPSIEEGQIREKLGDIRKAVLHQVPGSRVAKDQPYRLYDLAIDFREDPPELGLSAAEEIKAICESFGAQAKISSIHVNAWFGEYDKLSMAKHMLKALWKVDDAKDRILFCGDSVNDEPMFSAFPVSVGVSNIRNFLHLLKAFPSFVTEAPFGRGFTEAVNILLSRRN